MSEMTGAELDAWLKKANDDLIAGRRHGRLLPRHPRTLEATMTHPRFNGIVWSDLKATMDAGKPLPADMGFQPPQPISPPTERPAGPMCRPPDMDLGEDPPPPLPARSYGPVVARRGWLLRAIERIFG